MKNNKGQALVEFVIILPIFIFMLLAMIDIGKMIYFKNELESDLSFVVDLYKNKKSYQDISSELAKNDEEVVLEIKNENNKTVTFYLKKPMVIVTPGLSSIFGDPYEIEVKRVISYE